MRGSRRRGLAPLELVLSLPILLMVMALMINFGTVACWKVRGLGVSRQCVWGNRWPRSTANFPQPVFWPQSSPPGVIDLAAVVRPKRPRAQSARSGRTCGPDQRSDELDRWAG